MLEFPPTIIVENSESPSKALPSLWIIQGSWEHEWPGHGDVWKGGSLFDFRCLWEVHYSVLSIHCLPMELLTKAPHGLRHSVSLLSFGICPNPPLKKVLGWWDSFSLNSWNKICPIAWTAPYQRHHSPVLLREGFLNDFPLFCPSKKASLRDFRLCPGELFLEEGGGGKFHQWSVILASLTLENEHAKILQR